MSNTNRDVTFTFETADQADLSQGSAWRATFENGVQAIARYAPSADRYSRRAQHPRVYGALNALAPEEMAKEPHKGYRIPMVDRTDAEEQMAKEWSAWKRRTVKVAKTELIRLLEAVQDEDIAPAQITFSLHAGCSCPCSPGFIVKGVAGLTDIIGIWFTAPAE